MNKPPDMMMTGQDMMQMMGGGMPAKPMTAVAKAKKKAMKKGKGKGKK